MPDTIPNPLSPPKATLEDRVADLEKWRAAQEAAPTSAEFKPRAGWYKPNDTETTAFAHKYGWESVAPGVQDKLPPQDANDIPALYARAAFGYRPNGERWVWTGRDLDRARTFCDELAAAPSAQAAEALAKGAGAQAVEIGQYLAMIGILSGGGLAGTPELYLTNHDTGGPVQTVAEAVASLAWRPGGGATPSGR